MKKIILIIFLFTISCSNNKVVNNHGFTGLEIKLDKIKLSETNKNDILTSIGKPSTVSLFDENVWFYIEREKVTQIVVYSKKKTVFVTIEPEITVQKKMDIINNIKKLTLNL